MAGLVENVDRESFWFVFALIIGVLGNLSLFFNHMIISDDKILEICSFRSTIQIMAELSFTKGFKFDLIHFWITLKSAAGIETVIWAYASFLQENQNIMSHLATTLLNEL